MKEKSISVCLKKALRARPISFLFQSDLITMHELTMSSHDVFHSPSKMRESLRPTTFCIHCVYVLIPQCRAESQSKNNCTWGILTIFWVFWLPHQHFLVEYSKWDLSIFNRTTTTTAPFYVKYETGQQDRVTWHGRKLGKFFVRREWGWHQKWRSVFANHPIFWKMENCSYR